MSICGRAEGILCSIGIRGLTQTVSRIIVGVGVRLAEVGVILADKLTHIIVVVSGDVGTFGNGFDITYLVVFVRIRSGIGADLRGITADLPCGKIRIMITVAIVHNVGEATARNKRFYISPVKNIIGIGNAEVLISSARNLKLLQSAHAVLGHAIAIVVGIGIKHTIVARVATQGIGENILRELQALLVVVPIGALQDRLGGRALDTVDQLAFGIIVISVGATCFRALNRVDGACGGIPTTTRRAKCSAGV